MISTLQNYARLARKALYDYQFKLYFLHKRMSIILLTNQQTIQNLAVNASKFFIKFDRTHMRYE